MFDLLKRDAATVGVEALGTNYVRFFAGTDGQPKMKDSAGTLFDFKGADGRGIVSIARTSGNGAAGTTDTYTVTYTTGQPSTFTVTNGANGAVGRGITSITRTTGTGAPGTTDTYTITYTDATTSTFTVYNGANGTNGVSPTVTVGATTVVTPATSPSVTDADAGPNADLRFSLPRARAVAAGTTTTGAAGTSASVSSATDANGDVTLNFTIPRGDTGAAGAGSPPTSAPPAVAASSAIGTNSGRYANEDHTHAHGSQAGGTTHAEATPTVAGFLPASGMAQLVNFDTYNVNILDFAADQNPATLTALRNGTTPIGTALTAAIAALPNGGVVMFPPGVYNFTAGFTISTAHITLQGAARYNTVFMTTATTGDILTLNQYYITIAGVTLTGPGTGQNPTKTAGYAINSVAATAAYGLVKNCTLTYQFDGINIGCTLMDVEDLEIRFFKGSAIAVTQNSDHRITKVTADNNTSFLPTGAGVLVTATASLLMDQLNLIHCNNTLDIAPGAGVTVPSVKAVNCFFDNAVTGLRMVSAGSFFRSQFTNCWFSSMSTAGILFGPTTAGNNVDGITFVNCDIYNNVAGTTNGVSVTTGNVGKWRMVACNIAGWTNGINIVGGANHFAMVQDCTIGAVAAFGVNTTGIVIATGTYKGILITGNECSDNATALTLGTVTVANFRNFRISSNTAINPRGTVTPPVTAPVSATTYTNNTGFPVIVMYRTGATTAPTNLTINGVSTVLPAAGNLHPIPLEPGGTFAFTGTVAPTWTWVGN